MKEFNAKKFCKDLIALRGKESQDKFAQKFYGYINARLDMYLDMLQEK